MSNKLFSVCCTGRRVLLIAIALASFATPSRASTTKVGNGDDGSDLEGARKIESGILVETRKKAIARMDRLDTAAIEHLGSLAPELERSEMYLVTKDVAVKLDEDRGIESSPDGSQVYARTFAEPYAATRFFPAALTLNEEQLISLHVHEALHRALPPSIREDEKIVTKITLALTAPDATRDRVARIVRNEVNEDSRINGVADASGATLRTRAPLEPKAPDLERPSSVTYSYRSFFIPDRDKSAYPIESLHSVQSFLYPFGGGSDALGLGLEASYITTSDQSFMGPLQVSARWRFATVRGFDVGVFGQHSMDMLAPDELKNSRIGRDVSTIGLSMKRMTDSYYVENTVSHSGQSEAKQKLGRIEYTHSYGPTVAATVRAGGRYKGFEIGGFGEALLSDYYRVKGGAFRNDSGRYRIISAGPEIAFSRDALRAAISAHWVVNSTGGATLDDVGDVLGRGLGQGSISSSLSLRF